MTRCLQTRGQRSPSPSRDNAGTRPGATQRRYLCSSYADATGRKRAAVRDVATAVMLDISELSVPAPTKSWVPQHVRITRAAAEMPHTATIIARCEAAGVQDISVLPGNQLIGMRT